MYYLAWSNEPFPPAMKKSFLAFLSATTHDNRQSRTIGLLQYSYVYDYNQCKSIDLIQIKQENNPYQYYENHIYTRYYILHTKDALFASQKRKHDV